VLYIAPGEEMSKYAEYRVEIPRGAVTGGGGSVNNAYSFSFSTAGVDSIKSGSIGISNTIRIGSGVAEGEALSITADGYPANTELSGISATELPLWDQAR
jgi:hypothetical protein